MLPVLLPSGLAALLLASSSPPSETLLFRPDMSRPGRTVRAPLLVRGVTHELELRPVSRRGPGFRALVVHADGREELEVPELEAYRGRVDGERWGTALFVDGPNGMLGAVRLGGEELFFRPTDAWDDDPRLLVLETAEQAAAWSGFAGGCGVVAPPTWGAGLSLDGGGTLASSALRIAEVAYDATYPYFQSCGSDVVATVQNVEVLNLFLCWGFGEPFGIEFELGGVVVREDPYYVPTYGQPAGPSAFLNHVGTEWFNHYGSIPRDFVLALRASGLGGKGGVAQVDSLCAGGQPRAWAVSSPEQNLLMLAGLPVHEVGHVFGAQHCDVYAPCAGDPCGVMHSSSISDLDFTCSANVTTILTAKSKACLADGVTDLPQITTLSPASATVFDIVGLGLGVVVDATPLEQAKTLYWGAESAGFADGSGLVEPIDGDSFVVHVPSPSVLGPITVAFDNYLGESSNTAVFTVLEDPSPRLGVHDYAFEGFPVEWVFAGPLGFDGELRLSFDGQTTVEDGVTVLVGAMPALGVATDVLGAGSYSQVLRPEWPTTVYSQFVQRDASTGSVTAASEVQLTIKTY